MALFAQAYCKLRKFNDTIELLEPEIQIRMGKEPAGGIYHLGFPDTLRGSTLP